MSSTQCTMPLACLSHKPKRHCASSAALSFFHPHQRELQASDSLGLKACVGWLCMAGGCWCSRVHEFARECVVGRIEHYVYAYVCAYACTSGVERMEEVLRIRLSVGRVFSPHATAWTDVWMLCAPWLRGREAAPADRLKKRYLDFKQRMMKRLARKQMQVGRVGAEDWGR